MEHPTVAPSVSLIYGVTITPPTIGRVMLGHIETRKGKGSEKDKHLPVKDDHFTITTLEQKADRSWHPHPIEKSLATGNTKLSSIPIRIAYNDPKLSLNSSYSAFNSKGRVMCTGNGCKAKRLTAEGMKEIDCPRPEGCSFGQENHCKNMTRFYFQIDGQDDELGMFILRTTSYNSLDRLAGRLNQWSAITGGKIAGLPLLLTLVPKTSAQSYRTPFYFTDIPQRVGMSVAQAAKEAALFQKKWADDGLLQDPLEAAMLNGLQNSDFADELEDIDEWMSDEDFLATAENGLKLHGLSGLDKLVGAAKAGDVADVAAIGSEIPVPA